MGLFSINYNKFKPSRSWSLILVHLFYYHTICTILYLPYYICYSYSPFELFYSRSSSSPLWHGRWSFDEVFVLQNSNAVCNAIEHNFLTVINLT